MKDRHKGETCIITGMGPSFEDVPNKFLESYITFGVNKIWLKEFAPTYYVATDPWMNQYTRWMDDMHCSDYFLLPSFARGVGGSIGVVYKNDAPEEFTHDPRVSMRKGYGTVVHVALRFAYLMGFTTALLVGLDHTGDGVHFHPSYDVWGAKRTYKWNKKGVEQGFQLARDEYEADGRRIINLTPGSKCTVFEKEDIGLWQTHI